MPPIVALILCTIFVLWLLRLDRKCSPDCSIALWLPAIWVLLIASKPLGVWLLRYRSAGETGSPFDRNFITTLLIIGIIVLMKRRFSFSQAIKDNIWLIFLVVYLFISTVWSSMFSISVTRFIRETPVVIMAFIILSEHNPREAMLSVLRRTTYILIPFSVLLIKYFPEYGVQYSRWSGEISWIGVTMQKNGLGRLCLIAVFFLFWSIIKRRKEHHIAAVKYQTAIEIFLIIVAFYLLKGPSIGAMSATAVTSLTVGLTVFLGLLFMNKIKFYPSVNTLMAIITAVIIFGVFTVFSSGTTVGSFTTNIGRDATLTGRTEVWQNLLPVAMKHPILGHGFGGFWTAESRDFFMISEAHSGYLDVLLEIGFVGLILVTLFLLSSCRKAQQMLKDNFYWASLWICFLIMAVIHNISESSINALSSHLTAILVFFSVASSSLTSVQEKVQSEVCILHNDHS